MTREELHAALDEAADEAAQAIARAKAATEALEQAQTDCMNAQVRVREADRKCCDLARQLIQLERA